MKPLFAISFLLFSTAAAAQIGSTTASDSGTIVHSRADAETEAPAATPEDSNERRICRREETTSTRVRSRRLCLTARQWREHARRN